MGNGSFELCDALYKGPLQLLDAPLEDLPLLDDACLNRVHLFPEGLCKSLVLLCHPLREGRFVLVDANAQRPLRLLQVVETGLEALARSEFGRRKSCDLMPQNGMGFAELIQLRADEGLAVVTAGMELLISVSRLRSGNLVVKVPFVVGSG